MRDIDFNNYYKFVKINFSLLIINIYILLRKKLIL